MNIPANNPSLKSWLEVAPASDFPIQNIPFGVFSVEEDDLVIGTRIGDFAISLTALNDLGFFKDIDFDDNVLYDETLNALLAKEKKFGEPFVTEFLKFLKQTIQNCVTMQKRANW